jgi:hypothetical protein
MKVVNTGDIYLNTISISDKAINFQVPLNDTLAPGASTTVPVPRKILADLVNSANVTATPVLKDGSIIPGLPKVTAVDSSEVAVVAFQPSVNIDNKVYLGKDGGAKCGTNATTELVKDYPSSAVTICMAVKNTGDSFLGSVAVTNPTISFTDSSIGSLAPGATKMLFAEGIITATVQNTAIVTANPTLASGDDIPNAADVKSSDSSGVELLNYQPVISIDNVVYLGHDAGATCGDVSARDYAEGIYGDACTYCFVVVNHGDTYLKDIKIDDKTLGFTSSSIPSLAPKESKFVYLETTITGSLKNMAVVNANPVTKDLVDIPNLADVTASDPSAVGKLHFEGGITVDSTGRWRSISSYACCCLAYNPNSFCRYFYVQSTSDTMMVLNARRSLLSTLSRAHGPPT